MWEVSGNAVRDEASGRLWGSTEYRLSVNSPETASQACDIRPTLPASFAFSSLRCAQWSAVQAPYKLMLKAQSLTLFLEPR